jgi:hypothetical protein
MILILRLLVIGMLSIFLGHYAFGSDINKQRQSSSVGTGLQGLADWSSQYPFLDTMKLSRVWFDWERRTAEGIQVNGKGWVTSFDKGLRPRGRLSISTILCAGRVRGA